MILLGLLMLLDGRFGANALAAESLTVDSLREQIHVLYATGHTPCPTTADPAIHEIIFAIDGASGYSPTQYLLKFPNLQTGQTGYDFFRADPLNPEKIKLYAELRALEAVDRGNGRIISALAKAVYRVPGAIPKQVLYYPWDHYEAAAECAMSVRNLYAAANVPLVISSTGFSLGGYGAVLFNRILNKHEVFVKNVFTIDPVPFTQDLPRALVHLPNHTRIKVPSNHGHWKNVYQTKDQHTLSGIIPIHGAQLTGQVTNNIPVDREGKEVTTHMKMPGCEESEEELARMLAE